MAGSLSCSRTNANLLWSAKWWLADADHLSAAESAVFSAKWALLAGNANRQNVAHRPRAAQKCHFLLSGYTWFAFWSMLAGSKVNE
jgi:hypothetical protein